MRTIGKTPIEIFGHDYTSKSPSFALAIKQQYCKYLKDTCNKPRKSEPHIKVGICTLGSTVCKGKEVKPVIICPQRFKEETMFETIREKYLSHWNNVKWVQEVNIGVGGNVDYVAVEIDDENNITDFLCVEIQAAGTTGTPYPAVRSYIETGSFANSKYIYGINWANEFSKTMMQQAYKKGKIVESWGRKIVFVVQDVAMDYIKSTSDCSLLVPSDHSLPVDFCSFYLKWVPELTEWKLHFNKIESTSIEGVNRILGGASVNEYLTEAEFIQNIIKKGFQDRIFSSDTSVSNKFC